MEKTLLNRLADDDADDEGKEGKCKGWMGHGYHLSYNFGSGLSDGTNDATS